MDSGLGSARGRRRRSRGDSLGSEADAAAGGAGRRRSRGDGLAEDVEAAAAAATTTSAPPSGGPAAPPPSPRPRGIMRARPAYTPQSSSLSGGAGGGDARTPPPAAAAGGGLKTTGLPPPPPPPPLARQPQAGRGRRRLRRRRREVPPLSALARDALLFGLADGRETALSEAAQRPQPDWCGGGSVAPPAPTPTTARRDGEARIDADEEAGAAAAAPPTETVRLVGLGSGAALLRSEQFWDGLLAEARRRRVLSDAFLTALCASGLPPSRLELRGGLGDAGVTDRWLVEAPPRQPHEEGEQGAGAAASGGRGRRRSTFASASEMALASLRHLRLSGGRSKRKAGDVFSALGGSERAGEGGNVVERLPLAADFEAFLHRVARSSAHLETLHLGPGLLRNDGPNKWLGALKAISANCSMLRSLEVEGVSFGPSGRESSVGGAEAGATSSVSALFEAMAANCASLERLSLSRCGGVQDRHVQALLLELRDGSASVPKLKELDLSYTGVDGLSFAALCSRQYSTDDFGGASVDCIRKLNLDGTAVDVSWLKRILATMGDNLEELSLLECVRLIDAGPEVWSALSFATTATAGMNTQANQQSSLSHLSSLRLELCFDLSDVPVSYIAEATAHAVSAAESNDFKANESQTGCQYGALQPETVECEPNWWACRRCTLVNEPGSHRCAACNSRRWDPPDLPVNSNAPSDEISGSCRTDGGTDDLQQTPTKRNSFELQSLGRLPLKEFVVLLHLREQKTWRENKNESKNDIAGADVSTMLTHRILDALPRSVAHLSLLFPGANENGSAGDQQHYEVFFRLDEPTFSFIQRTFSGSLRSLELGPLCLTDANAFREMLVSLRGLSVLKLFGCGFLGLPTAVILREMFGGCVEEDNSAERCPNLEIVQLTVSEADEFVLNDVAAMHGSHLMHGRSHNHEEEDVVIVSLSLKRLWLEGCLDLEVLSLNTPFLERLTVVDCSSLASLQFVGDDGVVYQDDIGACDDISPKEPSGGRLEHLRLSNCANLSPYCVASMQLPKLARLDVDGLILIEDWEFGALVAGAGQSLTSLRLNQCRSLGDARQWRDPSIAFHPLSVLHVRQPSPAFDLLVLQTLFFTSMEDTEFACCLRDLIIENASGIKGILCAPAKPLAEALHAPGMPEDDGCPAEYHERLANHLSKSSALFLPGGLDEEMADLQSARGVERILSTFIERARDGGADELGFPPTLTSYQRKLVHEVAEDLNIEHESVRLGSGAKFVRLKMRVTENMGVFDLHDDEAAAGDDDANVEAEPQQQQGVTFALDGDGIEHEESIDDINGVFEMDEDASAPHEDEPDLVHEERPLKAQSRRQKRKARKAAKKAGIVPSADATDDNAALSDSDGEDDGDEVAFDPLLQCERFARFDPKMYRRLTSLAHKLPTDPESGTAVCLRFLRGVCPYQSARGGGDACRYAHFDVKSSQQKKFAPLLDYVCGKAEEPAAGGRRSKRRSHKQSSELSTSFENVSGSYGTEDAMQFMDAHLGNGKKGRKSSKGRRRKGSIGNEGDHDSDGMSRSYGTDEGTSDEGLSSRGTSPARSGNGEVLSSSPGTYSPFTGKVASNSFDTSPLNLQRLLSLELMKCSALTGACLDGPCLVRISLQGCTRLDFLDITAPVLTNLDVSECSSLRSFPLHSGSLRRLKVANLTGCKNLQEGFMSKLVNHSRGLRQLHIFGSGAAEKGRNIRERQRIKTKANFLAKLTAGRPELEVVTTKKEWRAVRAKREGAANSRFEEEEGLVNGLS